MHVVMQPVRILSTTTSHAKCGNQYSLSQALPDDWCPIWDDVRTYLTSTIDPKEKSVLIVAISYFKKEEQQ